MFSLDGGNVKRENGFHEKILSATLKDVTEFQMGMVRESCHALNVLTTMFVILNY